MEMSIIDPEGFFNGDRLRRCSNLAQLHWPRLFLASNGFGRLEINYAKIIGRAYGSFKPVPSEADLNTYLGEYVQNFLLFVYDFDGQTWGQWDTNPRFLPRFKTAADRRSPAPPEVEWLGWKQGYLSDKTRFPKSFRNISGTFRSGVGVGVGEGIGVGDTHKTVVCVSKPKVSDLNGQTSPRWGEFISKYPRKQKLDAAARNFVSYVTIETDALVFACLDRYLRSAEVGRGVVMNPDRWLYEQHCNGWAGDWPARPKTLDEIIEEKYPDVKQ